MNGGKLKVQLAIGLLLSAVLLWLSVRTLNFHEILAALAGANWLWFLPICLQNSVISASSWRKGSSWKKRVNECRASVRQSWIRTFTWRRWS